MALPIEPSPQMRVAPSEQAVPTGSSEYPEGTTFESVYPEGFLDEFSSSGPLPLGTPSLFDLFDLLAVSVGEPGVPGEGDDIDAPAITAE
jgi:hypothetical protein